MPIMKRLTDGIIQFFHSQHFVVVATVEENGYPHSSCKDIVDINKNGSIALLDLYKGKTYRNLQKNPRISITAVDEHRFIGYSLKGKARIIKKNKLKPNLITAWNDRIANRITHRFLKNIRGEKGHPRHPEVLLPKPEYLILMQVEQVIDLTPGHLK